MSIRSNSGRSSTKRKMQRDINQDINNSENVKPIDFIDLTVDSPQYSRPKKIRHKACISVDLSTTVESNPVQQRTLRFICPICFEDLTEDMKPTSTKCGHIFCDNCLQAAYKVKKNCPKCREKISLKTCTRLHFDHS